MTRSLIANDDKAKLLTTLIGLDDLKDSFEFAFSIIPFSSLFWTFADIILLMYSLMVEEDPGALELQIMSGADIFFAILACSGMLWTVSLLQDRLDYKCSHLCNLIRFKALKDVSEANYQFLMKKVQQTYMRPMEHVRN